jgi:hypothetical protein
MMIRPVRTKSNIEGFDKNHSTKFGGISIAIFKHPLKLAELK